MGVLHLIVHNLHFPEFSLFGICDMSFVAFSVFLSSESLHGR